MRHASIVSAVTAAVYAVRNQITDAAEEGRKRTDAAIAELRAEVDKVGDDVANLADATRAVLEAGRKPPVVPPRKPGEGKRA